MNGEIEPIQTSGAGGDRQRRGCGGSAPLDAYREEGHSEGVRRGSVERTKDVGG